MRLGHAPPQHHRSFHGAPAHCQRRRGRCGWSSTGRSTTTSNCGRTWRLARDGRKADSGRYWRLDPPCETERAGLDEAALCEEIREVFDESVRLRMIADVPLGALLSGGIDSSLVVASMAR